MQSSQMITANELREKQAYPKAPGLPLLTSAPNLCFVLCLRHCLQPGGFLAFLLQATRILARLGRVLMLHAWRKLDSAKQQCCIGFR